VVSGGGGLLSDFRFRPLSASALSSLPMPVSEQPLLGAIRIPVPEPVREPNRCNLEPFKLETPRITPNLVLAQGRSTLQLVCLCLAHFRSPVRRPKSPSRPTRENSGKPCGGGLGGGECQTARWRRIVPTGSWSRPKSLAHRSPKQTLTGFGSGHGSVTLLPKHEGPQARCWSAGFPDLPGCTSAGDTEEEAVADAKEALALGHP
jgi:hypothetical protein